MPKDSASDDPDAIKPRGAFRPDLSQSTTRNNDTDRILSSLGSSKGAFSSGSPKSKTSVVTFAVLMLISAGAAVLGYQYFANQSTTASSPAVLPKTVDVAAVAKAGPAGEESGAGAGLPAPAQAAEIVNEPPASKKPKEPTTNAQTQLTDALEKDVKPPNAALEKALESKPGAQVRPGVDSTAKTALAVTAGSSGTGGTGNASTSAKGLSAGKSDSVKTNKSTVASSSSNSNSNSNSNSKQGSGGAGLKASTNTAAAGDKDINLIAALLSHNAATQSAARSTGVKSNPSVKADVQVKNTDSSAATDASQRTASATAVQSSLKQCENLDFFQREICRLKTCDKLWESDSACKATLTSTR